MPRNGSGGYTLPAGNPVVAGTVITDSWANTTVADLATEIAGSMTIDGQTPLTGSLKGATGTVSAPSYSFNAELNTGIYRPAVQTLGVTVNGVEFGRFTTTALQPSTNNTYNLGTSGLRWGTIYGTTIDATTFTGVSTTAKYADLAERYHADAEYTPGTLVQIGGFAEITQVNQPFSSNVFGVISTAPGFCLNSDAGDDKEWPYVALAGRVPVRVIGSVKKGDKLVSAGNGCAMAGIPGQDNLVGYALADKIVAGEGLVMAAVK